MPEEPEVETERLHEEIHEELEREGDSPLKAIALTTANFGAYPMANGLTRLATRFCGVDAAIARPGAEQGKELDAAAAEALGLVTFAPDELDWEDEIRLAVDERASLSGVIWKTIVTSPTVISWPV